MGVQVRREGGCGCFGCLTSLLSAGVFVGVSGLSFGLLFALPNGGEPQALAALNACPAATAALGGPVQRRAISPGCGEQETGGGAGRASWSFEVVGTRASGRLSYTATFEGGGPWQVNGASVRVGEQTIPVVPCATPPAPERPEPPRERPRRGEDRRRR